MMKIDPRIEQIERRPRKRVDIFLSQQRTKENSFRIDVLDDKDPHYTIKYANLPVILVQSLVTLDLDCSNFQMAKASSLLEASFTCLHPALCELTSDVKADFLRHASHIVNPKRHLNSLDLQNLWFAPLEKFFKIKIWLLDVQSKCLRKTSKLYLVDKTLNIIVVKSAGEWFSLLHQDIDKQKNGVMSSRDFKDVFTNLCDSLTLVDVTD